MLAHRVAKECEVTLLSVVEQTLFFSSFFERRHFNDFLNVFDHQATVLDWDLDDDEDSPTNQVPKLLLSGTPNLSFRCLDLEY